MFAQAMFDYQRISLKKTQDLFNHYFGTGLSEFCQGEPQSAESWGFVSCWWNGEIDLSGGMVQYSFFWWSAPPSHHYLFVKLTSTTNATATATATAATTTTTTPTPTPTPTPIIVPGKSLALWSVSWAILTSSSSIAKRPSSHWAPTHHHWGYRSTGYEALCLWGFWKIPG